MKTQKRRKWDRQTEVLRFIAAWRDEFGVGPRGDEIAEFCESSQRTAWRDVAELEGRGKVEHTDGMARSVRTTGTPLDEVEDETADWKYRRAARRIWISDDEEAAE